MTRLDCFLCDVARYQSRGLQTRYTCPCLWGWDLCLVALGGCLEVLANISTPDFVNSISLVFLSCQVLAEQVCSSVIMIGNQAGLKSIKIWVQCNYWLVETNCCTWVHSLKSWTAPWGNGHNCREPLLLQGYRHCSLGTAALPLVWMKGPGDPCNSATINLLPPTDIAGTLGSAPESSWKTALFLLLPMLSLFVDIQSTRTLISLK